MIIKNNNIGLNTNNYLFYIDKFLKVNNILEKEDSLIINYILNYENDKFFFKDLEKIIKKDGLQNFIQKNELNINEMKYEQNIQDDKRNNIGTFINIRLNEEDIKNIEIEMNQNSFQKKDSNIIKNTLAITSEFLQIEKKNEKPDQINKKKK